MKTNVVNYTTFLNHAELEYRTFYRTKKWTASQSDLSSGFYVAPIADAEDDYNAPTK